MSGKPRDHWYLTITNLLPLPLWGEVGGGMEGEGYFMYGNSSTTFVPSAYRAYINSFVVVAPEDLLLLSGNPWVEILYIYYEDRPKALVEIRYPYGTDLGLSCSGNQYIQIEYK